MRWTMLRLRGGPRTALLLCLSALSVTGCSASTRGLCLTDRPILVDRADVLTDATVTAILTHNERYAALCG